MTQFVMKKTMNQKIPRDPHRNLSWYCPNSPSQATITFNAVVQLMIRYQLRRPTALQQQLE